MSKRPSHKVALIGLIFIIIFSFSYAFKDGISAFNVGRGLGSSIIRGAIGFIVIEWIARKVFKINK